MLGTIRVHTIWLLLLFYCVCTAVYGSRTTPHRMKIKPNYCPPGPQSLGLFLTRTTIPRTIPHQDNSLLGPLPRNKATHQDQYLYGGELSWWGVVRIWQYMVNDLPLYCTHVCGESIAGERLVVPKVKLGEQRVKTIFFLL